jgi:hypothetical protein
MFMLAIASFHDPTMRDLEQELKATLAGLHTRSGEPREGLHVLTRRMENEEEEQFDVDLTILDFLVYKATGLVFEWKSSADPYHSDLPSALVTMTGGAWPCRIRLCMRLLMPTRMENLPFISTPWPPVDSTSSAPFAIASVLAHIHPSTPAWRDLDQ